MHLLYLTQYYVTEDQPGTPRHYRHANFLVQNAHRVTVVTSYVTHAERTIPAQYEGKKIHKEQEGDLTVFRTYAYPNYGRDIFSRLWNYLTFMLYSLLAGLRARNVDMVLASINPVSVGLVGWFLSLLNRAPFVLEVADLSAESAEALGVVRSQWFIRLIRWLEEFLFRRAKRVIVLAKGIGKAVERGGVAPERIAFIPLGVDVDVAQSFTGSVKGIRQNNSEFIAMYVGSYTTYPSLDTALLAANQLKSHPDIRFVFIGGGDQREHMEEIVQQLDLHNVTIHGVRPKRAVSAILAEANVCVLPLRDADVFRGVLPNKLFDYLGSGHPVITAVPTGEITAIIQESQAGICVPPEQPEELAKAILWIYDHPEEAKRMGESGRQYIIENFDREKIMSQYMDLLEETVNQ